MEATMAWLVPGYKARLSEDLARWRAAGWVTPDGARAIEAELASGKSAIGLAPALATLGAILIGFAAMSFVAANWDHMSRLARLTLLGTGLVATYGAAIELYRRKLDRFAETAALAGIGLFGASIMLIAQMYHMHGEAADAVLLWGIGALIVAWATLSNTIFAASLLIFGTWSYMSVKVGIGQPTIHWTFLPAWASVAAGFLVTRWKRGGHLAAITLTIWIIVSSDIGSGAGVSGHFIVLAIGAALMGVSIAFGPAIDRVRQISDLILNYGLILAYAGAFALQFSFVRTSISSGVPFAIVVALTLAGIIATLMWAFRTENRSALWIAYTIFSIEVFAIYLRQIGSRVSTAAFFLIAGLIIIALAAAAYRMHRASEPKEIAS
jgi:uncharacterized membrane protein